MAHLLDCDQQNYLGEENTMEDENQSRRKLHKA